MPLGASFSPLPQGRWWQDQGGRLPGMQPAVLPPLPLQQMHSLAFPATTPRATGCCCESPWAHPRAQGAGASGEGGGASSREMPVGMGGCCCVHEVCVQTHTGMSEFNPPERF